VLVGAAGSGACVLALIRRPAPALDRSQLYVNGDRARSAAYVQELARQGVRGLFVTVDAPQLGRREKDMRNKFKAGKAAEQRATDAIARDSGVARAISSFIDPSFSWSDLGWLMGLSSMPVYLKGVQCAEDAVLALRAGCAGVVLSNHGGRQLDASRSSLEVLNEVMPALRSEPGYRKDKFEVYIDGGVRRGADVFKALALGAAGVGLGRPTLYALASYGQQGIERLLQGMKEELEMVMQLMGTVSVSEISQKHVITADLASHISATPPDFLSVTSYEPLQTQAQRVGYGTRRVNRGMGGGSASKAKL
jgi:L-lactate dehydrogenase (cytochrome)